MVRKELADRPDIGRPPSLHAGSGASPRDIILPRTDQRPPGAIVARQESPDANYSTGDAGDVTNRSPTPVLSDATSCCDLRGRLLPRFDAMEPSSHHAASVVRSGAGALFLRLGRE